MKSFYRSRGSGKIPNHADATFSLSRESDGNVKCDLYFREDVGEEPKPFWFNLQDNDDGSVVLVKKHEQVVAIEKKQNTLAVVKEILLSEMGAPLKKTPIYNIFLKGKGIGGLSSDSFHCFILPALVKEGVLRQIAGGSYELVRGTSEFPEASGSD